LSKLHEAVNVVLANPRVKARCQLTRRADGAFSLGALH
jgi:hypothetical protein